VLVDKDHQEKRQQKYRDRFLVFSMRSIDSKEHNVVGREGTVSVDGSCIDSEFVGDEITCFVRAKNGDTGDNNLVLGELPGTNGKSDGQDSGRGNGN
jgi:hypothetical protein